MKRFLKVFLIALSVLGLLISLALMAFNLWLQSEAVAEVAILALLLAADILK